MAEASAGLWKTVLGAGAATERSCSPWTALRRLLPGGASFVHTTSIYQVHPVCHTPGFPRHWDSAWLIEQLHTDLNVLNPHVEDFAKVSPLAGAMQSYEIVYIWESSIQDQTSVWFATGCIVSIFRASGNFKLSTLVQKSKKKFQNLNTCFDRRQGFDRAQAGLSASRMGHHGWLPPLPLFMVGVMP